MPEDDDEKEGESRQTTHGFSPGDVFMVFEYVDYDLSGLLKCRDVVSTLCFVLYCFVLFFPVVSCVLSSFKKIA